MTTEHTPIVDATESMQQANEAMKLAITEIDRLRSVNTELVEALREAKNIITEYADLPRGMDVTFIDAALAMTETQ